jgi:nicotinate-nucleotide pyrophosphorylase (carboxylating)
MTCFTEPERAAARALIQLAFAEDFGSVGDLTCQAIIEPTAMATVNVVARQPGVLAGLPVGREVLSTLDPQVSWTEHKQDGECLTRGEVIAVLQGSLTSLLMGERTLLNFMTHLSGIATLTAQYVHEVAGTRAVILDTRKTHPGYRRLEKYAVRCGGGTNHRLGLYDGVLIKDNHLAAWTSQASIAAAIRTARERSPAGMPIEVEVDTLEQLRDALQGRPEIVLLDNMPPATLREAVHIRDAVAPAVLLEASGGVTLQTVRAIAETGVDRISIGALTHSAIGLDLALDWGDRSR